MRLPLTLILLVHLTTLLAQVPSGFVQRQVGRNLNPTALAFAPNGRLFVVEKDGIIREVIQDVLSGDPFLTLTNVDITNERGLLGLCFHPDFPKTPYFYVYYSVKDRDVNRLSRFTAGLTSTSAQSETVLMEFDPLIGTIHNSGALRFGLDRKLFVAVGDGGNPDGAQQLTTVSGKILRLNDDGSIPTDNPFYNQVSGKLRAIYALGFRNPFSMDVDPVSGRLFVGDVGLASFEEINDIKAGRNYGWPLIEGRRTTQTAPANYQDPLYTYSHDVGCAVTGVAFYNPPVARFPAEYKGKFFFADYCRGTLQTLNPENGQVVGDFVTDIARPVAVAVSPDGYLYYAARAGLGGGTQQDNTSTWNGTLNKVSYFDSGLPYISSQSTGALVPVGESVTFEVDAVGQKPLTYRWFRNDKLVAESTLKSYTISKPALTDNGAVYRCTVVNSLGTANSELITLKVVQGQRPIARIRQPATNTTYRAGETIRFAGDAVDANQNPVTTAKLTWWIDFHHEDHVHPALSPVTGPVSGSYVVPTVGETSAEVFYRVHLRATDPSGLFSESSIDVKPQVVTITVASIPALSDLTLDGEPLQAGFSFKSVVGTRRVLETRPYRATADGFYQFSGWNSQLRTTLINYDVPAQDAQLTMTYQPIASPGGDGLRGYYYSNKSEFIGSPSLIRIDRQIDFNWGESPPAQGVSDDNFVVRWSGKVQAPFSDTFTFYTQTDDGTRLWVNNKLLVDKWLPQPDTEWPAKIDLVGGQQYDLRMEYLEYNGNATARLLWESPKFSKAIINKGQLFSAPLITATNLESTSGLTAFPSPAREELTVQYTANTSGTAQLSVTDVLGRRLYEQAVQVKPGKTNYPVSVNSWPSGVYIVSMKADDQPAVYVRVLVR